MTTTTDKTPPRDDKEPLAAVNEDIQRLLSIAASWQTWSHSLGELFILETQQSVSSLGKLISLHLLGILFGSLFYLTLVIGVALGAHEAGATPLFACFSALLFQGLGLTALFVYRQRNKRKIGFHHTLTELSKLKQILADQAPDANATHN